MNNIYFKRLTIIAASSLMVLTAKAQDLVPKRCGTEYSHNHDVKFSNQQLQEQKNFEAFLLKEQNSRTTVASDIIAEIPVVIHVLYNTTISGSNISDAKIKSQIDILNADYGMTNANSVDVVSAFQSLRADSKIRFKLATIDPNGNPTTGIIRKATTKKMFAYETHDEKYTSKGGDDPWDNTKYLNVWIVPEISYGGVSSGLLGRGQFPDDPTKRNDGLTVRFFAWGTVAPVQQPYHLGRTATHEIGHWLGLKHPWGLKEGDCDGSDDDGITDTPLQSTQSGGQTTPYPQKCELTKKTCGVLNMTQNFMDYTDDQCLALFTTGQVAKMKYTLQTYRQAFLNPVTTGLENDVLKENQISVYPNPNNTKHLHFSQEVESATIFDMSGKVLQSVLNTDGFELGNTISSGLYILKLEYRGHSNNVKLIIE